MERPRGMKRFWVLTTMAVIAAANSPASATSRQAGFVDGGFSDGTWIGAISYSTDISLPGSSATGGLSSGSFVVTWSGGSPEGTFEGSGSTDIEFDDGASGSIETVVVGEISGSPTAPEIAFTSFVSTGSITTDGITIPIDLTLGPGETPNTPLDVTFSTCGHVSGNLDSAEAIAQGNAAQAGGTFAAQNASWSATKVDYASEGAPDGRVEDLGLLMLEGHNMADEIEAGNFPGPGFSDVLQRAQNFAASSSWNDACGQGDGSYGTIITDVMSRILTAMAANPLTFTADEWSQAINAGIASGSLGPGSGADGTQLRSDLIAALEIQIDIADGNPADVFDLHKAFVALGADEQADRTEALLEGEGE